MKVAIIVRILKMKRKSNIITAMIKLSDLMITLIYDIKKIDLK